MPDIEGYPTAAGVEAAIKEAAKKAAAADPSLDTNERIRLEHFNRFLSRIFSEGEESEWVLKGGTGVLARVPSGRTTRVCATMTEYNERTSSREKDLVDLVVFATTQDIDGAALRVAIVTEAHRRQMEPFDHFVVPATWGARYAKLSKPVPHCADYRTVDLAADLATRLIDPALSGDAGGKTWSHETLSWA